MIDGFLFQALIYITAAVVCVPIAKRLGMGSVLGYLIAGIVIGPSMLGFIGKEGQDIMHFAEFGVVMMLFLIGLEIEPAHFWKLRSRIFGLGGLQLCVTALFIGTGLYFVFGFSWQAALGAGLALSKSSTAIVMQTLKEKSLHTTRAGRSAFSVLLLQDMAVIPVLALLPFLAAQSGFFSGWEQAGLLVGAVFTVVVAGRYIIAPFLRLVAAAGLRELCVAGSLLIVIATAYLMKLCGLSPALGAFIAGVVLANSEFRHELESDIEPFKGLLLGLFFIAVGASINFALIAQQPATILTLVAAVLAVKACILMVLGRLFKIPFDQNFIFTVTLSQVGEFAFVIFAFMGTLQLLPPAWIDIMMAVIALSMSTTPVLMLITERLILPHFGVHKEAQHESDDIDVSNQVIIAGFSTFGSTVGRFLRANDVEATILDNNSEHVDLLRKMGFRVFYGDATRLDILNSAGASEAKILVIAIDDQTTSCKLSETVRKHFPNLTVMSRANNNFDAFALMEHNVQNIYRECLDASVRLSVDALVLLGFRRYSATRAGQKFIAYDEAAVQKLSQHRHDQKQYIHSTRQEIQMQEQLLSNDRAAIHNLNDNAWESDNGDEMEKVPD